MKLINKTSLNLTSQDKEAILKEISIANAFFNYSQHLLNYNGVKIFLQFTGKNWILRNIF